MELTERLYLIHKLVKSGRYPSAALFREKTGASPATIKRDLNRLRDYFCAPLEYDANRQGWYYNPKAPAFELPGLWFNPSELHALLTVEQLLENVQPGLLKPQLGPLRKRVRQLLNQGGYNVGELADKLRLTPFGARQPDADTFNVIAEATLSSTQLKIDYRPRSDVHNATDNRDRLLQPLRLQRYRDNWYLIAWCNLRQDLRRFSIDRISNPRPGSANTHQVRADDLERFCHGAFGIFGGSAEAWAVLRFSPARARWVADEEWHCDQIGQWRSDGSYELQVPYSDSRELLLEILRHGADVEVLAPHSLREALQKEVSRMSRLYMSFDDTD